MSPWSMCCTCGRRNSEMAVFSYVGLDDKGKEQSGTVDADSARDAARILRHRSVFVLKVVEGEQLLVERGFFAELFRVLALLLPHRHAPVGATDLVVFFRQTALMLRAGYTLVTALDASVDMVAKHRLKRSIKRMADEIRRGSSFSSMLAREKSIFSPMVAKLVASGEQSGNLDLILDRLAGSIERSKELKRQLAAAMVYPTFIMLSSVGVVIFLVVGVIPRFAKFLTARSAELPASTQLLMDISDWAVTWGGYLAGVAGIGLFFVLASYTTKPGKAVIDKVILVIPVVGTAVQFASMAQAGWTLSMLLRSGVTALDSLRITVGVISNRAVALCFDKAARGILEGRSLSRSFAQPHITMMMRHMAAVGESSGQLDTVMADVGEYYQKELSAKVKFISLMVEPTLILFVGGMVGFVYYAFFQAVMSVSKGGM